MFLPQQQISLVVWGIPLPVPTASEIIAKGWWDGGAELQGEADLHARKWGPAGCCHKLSPAQAGRQGPLLDAEEVIYRYFFPCLTSPFSRPHLFLHPSVLCAWDGLRFIVWENGEHVTSDVLYPSVGVVRSLLSVPRDRHSIPNPWKSSTSRTFVCCFNLSFFLLLRIWFRPIFSPLCQTWIKAAEYFHHIKRICSRLAAKG